MKYLFYLLFALQASQIYGFAQDSGYQVIKLKGIIYDKQNNEPLAYVSIGLKDKPIGTISDSDGHYSLEVYAENMTDTLLLSIIGNESKFILISKLLDGKRHRL